MLNNNLPLYIIITPFFPTPDSWRGAFCYDFVRALKRIEKYDVHVFMPEDGDDYEYNGIIVHRFKFITFAGGMFPFFIMKQNKESFLKKINNIGIKIEDIKICHSHEIFCLPLALALKQINTSIKIVHHFHAMGHPFHIALPRIGIVPFYSTFIYLYYRNYLENIDLPVFVSKRQKEMFGKWYPHGFLNEAEDLRKSLTFGKKLRKIILKQSFVLYNGIDYSLFYPNKDISSEKNNRIFKIGDVANFAESKDQMTLIRAVERLSKDDELKGRLKCILVGSGETLAFCQHYVSEHALGTIVEFKTEMDHLDLPEFYRSLDLFVSPSWAEGFGCTFIEAHGCGIPIMGCKGVSVDECFSTEEQEKWLFPPKDDETLAKKIKWFYKTRSKQTFIDKFDIDNIVEAFVKKIEKINKSIRE